MRPTSSQHQAKINPIYDQASKHQSGRDQATADFLFCLTVLEDPRHAQVIKKWRLVIKARPDSIWKGVAKTMAEFKRPAPGAEKELKPWSVPHPLESR